MIGTRERIGWVLVAASVSGRSVSFVLAKLAAMSSAGKGVAAMALNPWYAGELAALGLQAVAWTLALRRLPLSLAYPCTSLVYGVNLALAHVVFGEAINWVHVLGMAVIMAGVVVSARVATGGEGL